MAGVYTNNQCPRLLLGHSVCAPRDTATYPIFGTATIRVAQVVYLIALLNHIFFLIDCVWAVEELGP